MQVSALEGLAQYEMEEDEAERVHGGEEGYAPGPDRLEKLAGDGFDQAVLVYMNSLSRDATGDLGLAGAWLMECMLSELREAHNEHVLIPGELVGSSHILDMVVKLPVLKASGSPGHRERVLNGDGGGASFKTEDFTPGSLIGKATAVSQVMKGSASSPGKAEAPSLAEASGATPEVGRREG